MKKILYLLAVVTIASVVAAACGNDEDDQGSGPVKGVGPGISIRQALILNLTGPRLIYGLLHVQNDQARLCEFLAESPPQCAGRFLEVKGLDLIMFDGLRSEGSVTWSDQPVQVLGTVEGVVLTVAENPRLTPASRNIAAIFLHRDRRVHPLETDGL